MTLDEFEKKHHMDFKGNILEEMLFFSSLDKLYIEFTPEQAIAIIKDFLIYADDIYNDLSGKIEESVEALETKLEDKVDVDKYDA